MWRHHQAPEQGDHHQEHQEAPDQVRVRISSLRPRLSRLQLLHQNSRSSSWRSEAYRGRLCYWGRAIPPVDHRCRGVDQKENLQQITKETKAEE